MTRRLVTLMALGALALTGCGGEGKAPEAAAALPAAPAGQRLDADCPKEVVVQLQWQPQSDMGALFQLLGPGSKVDVNKKSITGPLVTGGRDTGVELTLRAGGAAIGFQTVPSQMYVDPSITLGLVHGDQVLAASGGQRVVGVTPLLKYSPAIIMWDPASHPDWTSIADIGRSGAPVVVSKGQYYPDWLVARGLVQKKQIEQSYDGSPARFAGDPKIAQQGFANSEPYTFEHQTPAWNKPVKYQLLKDAGYDIYASNVSVRADKLAELTPCLKKLVPLIQQAGADYVTGPAAANKTIVDMVAKIVSFSPYAQGEADYSAGLLKERGLLANEADGSVGTYDLKRVQGTIATLLPVLKAGGADVPATLKPEDVFTGEFTDPKIGIK